MTYRLIWLFCILLTGCGTGKTPSQNQDGQSAENLEISYARGFTVLRHKNFTEVTVRNPWDTLKILQRYLLVERDQPIPEDLPEGTVLRTPVQSIACLYSVHAGMISRLKSLDRLKAVAEPQFIFLPEIQTRLSRGEIASLGESVDLDIEKLIEVQPEAVLVSPFENAGYGPLTKTGIPLIECTDYLENTPLGRAEWIKFIGLLFDKEEEAFSVFEKSAKSYERIKSKALKAIRKPTIFSELKTGQVWYVPGGESYMGCLFKDAGAQYLWEDTPETGSLPLAYEAVFEKASDADYWLIKYATQKTMTYKDLASDFEGYSFFSAFRNRKIIACNTATCHYYEEGALEPEVLLADLVRLIHPELMEEYQPIYFQWMAE